MAPAHDIQCSNSATAFRRPDSQQYHGIRQVRCEFRLKLQRGKTKINRILVYYQIPMSAFPSVGPESQ